jgi:hypothetical protein
LKTRECLPGSSELVELDCVVRAVELYRTVHMCTSRRRPPLRFPPPQPVALQEAAHGLIRRWLTRRLPRRRQPQHYPCLADSTACPCWSLQLRVDLLAHDVCGLLAAPTTEGKATPAVRIVGSTASVCKPLRGRGC